jgi:hypothetical protein
MNCAPQMTIPIELLFKLRLNYNKNIEAVSLNKYALFLFSFLLCCKTILAQKNDEALLELAFKKNSTQMLYQFCLNWQKESPPISDEEFAVLNDTLKEAYNLFSAYSAARTTYQEIERGRYFKPDSFFVISQNYLIVSIAQHQLYYSQHEIDSFILVKRFSDGLTDSVKKILFANDSIMDRYMISQVPGKKDVTIEQGMRMWRDNISPYHTSESKQAYLVDSITDFRPRLSNDFKWLYWSKKRFEMFSAFMQEKNKAQKNNPPQGKEAMQFLSKIITRVPGYGRPDLTGKYLIQYFNWFPQTIEYISSIMFDKKMEYAMLIVIDRNSGRDEIWHKENGHWKFAVTTGMWVAQE